MLKNLFKSNNKNKEKRLNRYATVPADVVSAMWDTYEKYNLSIDPDMFMEGLRKDLQKMVDKKIEVPYLDEYVVGKHVVKYFTRDSVDIAKEIIGDFAVYFCKNYAMMYEKNSYLTIMLGLAVAETYEEVCGETVEMLANDLNESQKKYFEHIRYYMDMSFDEKMKLKDAKTDNPASFITSFTQVCDYTGHKILVVENTCYILNLYYQTLGMTSYDYMKKYFYQLALDTNQITGNPENDAVLYYINKFINDREYAENILNNIDEDILTKENFKECLSDVKNTYLDEIFSINSKFLNKIQDAYINNYYGTLSSYNLIYNNYISDDNFIKNIESIFCHSIMSIICGYANMYTNINKERRLKLMNLWKDKKVIAWDENGIFHNLDTKYIISDYKKFIIDNFGLPSSCSKYETAIHQGLPLKHSEFVMDSFLDIVGRCFTGENLNDDGSSYMWLSNMYNIESVEWH